MMQDRGTPAAYRIVDPRSGGLRATGRLWPGEAIDADPEGRPRVVIFHRDP
jgi:hypothetical protein